MTEAEWLACDEPPRMLLAIRDQARLRLGLKVSRRKLRLFGCACCRQVWRRLTGKGARHAVEVAERFVDGGATMEDLLGACDGLRDSGHAGKVGFAPYYLSASGRIAGDFLGRDWGRGSADRQAALVRELVGNPFRRVRLAPGWLTPTVTGLAASAYEERALPSGQLDSARLSVLADALEEAGCADPDLLGHLRSPGPHVRGCWALDLVLGKG
jgi:hypothetical protein